MAQIWNKTKQRWEEENAGTVSSISAYGTFNLGEYNALYNQRMEESEKEWYVKGRQTRVMNALNDAADMLQNGFTDYDSWRKNQEVYRERLKQSDQLTNELQDYIDENSDYYTPEGLKTFEEYLAAYAEDKDAITKAHDELLASDYYKKNSEIYDALLLDNPEYDSLTQAAQNKAYTDKAVELTQERVDEAEKNRNWATKLANSPIGQNAAALLDTLGVVSIDDLYKKVNEDENEAAYKAATAELMALREQQKITDVRAVTAEAKADSNFQASTGGNAEQMLAAQNEIFLKWGGAADKNLYADYAYMTPHESKVYDTFAESDPQKSNQYLTAIKPFTASRATNAVVDLIQQATEEHPVAMSLLSPAFTLGEGTEYVGSLITKVADGELNSGSYRASAIKNTIREETRSQINSEFGKKVYDIGMSIADSTASLIMGGGVPAISLVIMGTSAASQTAQDVKARGGTDEQALGMGAIAGIIEVITEKIPLDNLFKAAKGGGKKAILNILKQSGIEATEEMVSEIAGVIADDLVMGNLSNYNLKINELTANGMSYGDAMRQANNEFTQQVIDAGIGGAVSGAGFGMVGSATGSVRLAAAGKAIIKGGTVDLLVGKALDLPLETAAHQLAQSLVDGTTKQTNSNIGQLLYEYNQQIKTDSSKDNAAPDTAQDALEQVDPAAEGVDPGLDLAARQLAGEVSTGEVAQDTPRTPQARNMGVATPQEGVESENFINTTGTATPITHSAHLSESSEKGSFDITGISSVQNGKMYLQTNDEGTVALDDIEFSNALTDILYSAAAAYDTDAAKTFVTGFEGGTSEDFARYSSGFSAVYKSAKVGLRLENIIQRYPFVAGQLSPRMQQLAYDAGRNAKNLAATPSVQAAGAQADTTIPGAAQAQDAMIAEQESTQSAAPAETTAENTPNTDAERETAPQETSEQAKKKPGVTRKDTKQNLSEAQRRQLQVLDVIGRKYGISIETVDSIPLSNSEESTAASAKFAINADFQAEYDAWDKKSTGRIFTLGTTSNALQSIGVKNHLIQWDAGKIIKIRTDHPAMTDSVIKQVPDILENPVIVMQSKNPQHKSRITIFGEVFDANGVPVLAVLELQPTGRDNMALDLIKVASAYGKDTNPQGLINSSNILYVDPDIKRTNTWLLGTKLQLPFTSSNQLGSNNKIAYSAENVNSGAGSINASFDPQTGRIQIAMDATDGAYLYVGMHELVHYVKEYNADGYGMLEDFVLDALRETGQDVDALVQYQIELAARNGIEMDEAGAREEVVANSVPAVLSDKATVRKLVGLDRTIAQQVADFLREFVETLKNIMSSLAKQKSWQQMEALQGDIDTLQEIADLFLVALGDAGATNYQKGDATESDGLTRYSAKNSSNDSIKKQLIANLSAVNALEPVADFSNTGIEGMSKAEQVKEISEEFKKFGYRIERKGFGTILIDGKRINHGINYVNNDAEYAAFFAVPRVLKRGVEISEHADHKRRGYSTYTFAAPVIINGMPGNVAVVVRKTGNYKYNVHRILTPDGTAFELNGIKKTEPTPDVGKLPNGNGMTSISPVSKHRNQVSTLADNASASSQRLSTSVEQSIPQDGKKSKFSLRDTLAVDAPAFARFEEAESIIAEQRKTVSASAARAISTQTADRIARKVISDTHSDYDPKVLSENLIEIITRFAQNPDIPADYFIEAGASAIKPVLAGSRSFDQSAYEADAGIRDYLKTTSIVLSDVQRQEVANDFDNYRTYRQSLFGSVNLTRDGVALDVAWQELSSMRPDLFDPHTNEGDMPAILHNVAKSLNKSAYYANEFGYDLDSAAVDMFLQVYSDYANASSIKTSLNKSRSAAKQEMQSRYAQLRKGEVARRQELSRRYNAAPAAEKKAIRKEYIQVGTDDHLAFLERQARIADWKAVAQKESAAVRKYRPLIENETKKLINWLNNPSKKHHVPEQMRKPVTEFVQSLDFAREGAPVASANWANKMQKMSNFMDKANKAVDMIGAQNFSIDEALITDFNTFIEHARETVSHVYYMNSTQLEELYRIVRAVSHAITDANKMHKNAKYETVKEAGEVAIQELASKRQRYKGKDILKQLMLVDTLEPRTFFKSLESVGETMWAALREGFREKMRRLFAAQDFVDDTFQQKNIKTKTIRAWSGPRAEIKIFDVKNGRLQLTDAHIMSLYALSHREQAYKHITEGGVRTGEYTGRLDGKKHKVIQEKPVTLTDAEIKMIIGNLTDEQLYVAEQFQEYLSTVIARYGNEASLDLEGYMKYLEEIYWMISSDSAYIKKDQKPGDSHEAIKNIGASKATVKGANNPIMLNDFFDAFVRHINDMTSYSTLAVPIADAFKWFNYKNANNDSVQNAIKRVYGQPGIDYFVKFMDDLNGLQSRNTGLEGMGLINAIIRKAKTAAVGFNPRTWIQQPMSYFRAANMISPKYLVKFWNSPKNIAEMKKYSPIARWKSAGFYDTNVGPTLRNVLIGDMSRIENARDRSLWMAGKMDEITWGSIWAAIKREIRATRPDLKSGTQEFFEAVAKRFEDVVDGTQVVDSVFHRSQITRSTDGLARMTTAFMSEPQKSLNMLITAFSDNYEQKTKASAKRLGRAIVVFAVSGIATAAAASLPSAFRDGDEEKTFGEKYLAAFKEDVFGNLNPLNLFPYIRDIWRNVESEVFGKYQNSGRMDMDVLNKAIGLLRELGRIAKGESKWSEYKVAYRMLDTAADFTGIPLDNLMRTFTSLVNTVSPGTIDMKSDTATNPKGYGTMYEALKAGDRDKYTATLEDMREKLAKNIRNEMAEGGRQYSETEIEIKVTDAIEKGIAAYMMENEPLIDEVARLFLTGELVGENKKRYDAIYQTLRNMGVPQNSNIYAMNSRINLINKGDAVEEVTPATPQEFERTDLYENMYHALTMGYEDDYDEYHDIVADIIRSDYEKKVADGGIPEDDVELYIENTIAEGMRDYLKKNDPRITEMAEAYNKGTRQIENMAVYREMKAEGFTEAMLNGAVKAAANALNKKDVNETKKYDPDLYVEWSMFPDVGDAMKEAVKQSVEKGDNSWMNDIYDELAYDGHTPEETKAERLSTYKTAVRANLYDYLDAGNDAKVDQYITALQEMIEEGEGDSDISGPMKTHYKPIYQQAYLAGNTAEMQRIESMLLRLGLMGKKGTPLFDDTTFEEWREKA